MSSTGMKLITILYEREKENKNVDFKILLGTIANPSFHVIMAKDKTRIYGLHSQNKSMAKKYEGIMTCRVKAGFAVNMNTLLFL